MEKAKKQQIMRKLQQIATRRELIATNCNTSEAPCDNETTKELANMVLIECRIAIELINEFKKHQEKMKNNNKPWEKNLCITESDEQTK